MSGWEDSVAELSIGQVSRRVGVSARTLRHWDKFGLFTPT
ncbi:helix-turn-helix domain-containing protein, partial [Rhodococcus qingshengii]